MVLNRQLLSIKGLVHCRNMGYLSYIYFFINCILVYLFTDGW